MICRHSSFICIERLEKQSIVNILMQIWHSHHKNNSFHQLISSQSISESKNRSIYDKINIFKYARKMGKDNVTIKLSRFLVNIFVYFERIESKAIFNRNIIFEMGQRNRIHALKYPNRLNKQLCVERTHSFLCSGTFAFDLNFECLERFRVR